MMDGEVSALLFCTVRWRRTASLKPVKDIAPQAFAPLLAAKFAQMLGVWRTTDPSRFAQAWLAKAHPVGTPLQVHSSPNDRVSGTFDGIEPDGALRLRRGDGMIDIIRAGDIYLG